MRPSTQQLRRWAARVDWSATYTCGRCGRTGPGYHVQPQPEGGALCTECINAINAEIRQARRRQLAAMPRCAVPGCRHRATRWHPNREHGTGLCGLHWRRAERTLLARMAATGLLLVGAVVVSREELVQAATGGEAEA